MRNFVTCVERIDGRHDAAGSRGRVEGDAILGAVWTDNPEHLAFLEAAAGGEVMGDDRDGVSQLCVSQRSACWTIDQGWFVRQFGGAMHNERRQGSFGNVYVRIRTFEYHRYFLGEYGFRFAAYLNR